MKHFFLSAIALFLLPFPVLANGDTDIAQLESNEPGCPQDIEPLVARMLLDLPGYANRVIARSRSVADRPIDTYVMLAGEADFEPLPLEPPQVDTPDLDNTSPNLHQVFFTTWERSYRDTGISDLQTYHWLFLVNTESGWRLDMMFSRSTSYPIVGPVTPPRESSRGTIGQALQLWLRDCRARSRY